MNIALIGGTHGNEPVGLEVMKLFKKSSKKYHNPFECFWANPKAYELKRRYVDSDLNRAFGKNGQPSGYEKQRAAELKKQIQDSFDFSIDLHTTTSNMGLTAILNNTNPMTHKAAIFLKQ
ncbi:MAG: succinylglutamate desuccinylase/aspartoacylase family protein, partial [Pseudomonadota bacterium]